MQIKKRIVLCCLTMLVTACVISKNSPEQAACQLSCKTKLNQCRQTCQNNCIRCGDRANQIMRKGYHQYTREECVRGGMITRQLQSYRDPLQCRKPTCNCQADYRVCTQSCTGVIKKRLQVEPVCC